MNQQETQLEQSARQQGASDGHHGYPYNPGNFDVRHTEIYRLHFWAGRVPSLPDDEVLAIIHSTNPNGAMAPVRVAAMQEWDRRFPVGSGKVAK